MTFPRFPQVPGTLSLSAASIRAAAGRRTRRQLGDGLRILDATRVRLSGLSRGWVDTVIRLTLDGRSLPIGPWIEPSAFSCRCRCPRAKAWRWRHPCRCRMPRDEKIVARVRAPKSAASTDILSLKVTLRGLKPPVWRRLLVPATMTLGELHTAIQAAMGWHDSHLHAFEIAGEEYGDRQMVDDVADENRVTLNRLAQAGIVRFAYTYDFGDNWEHAITIEKQAPALEAKPYPVCIAGKRNCPPEDCGGVWGYQDLLRILADPTHPDHAEQAEWIGDEFDPDEFDLDLANTVLAARFRKN